MFLLGFALTVFCGLGTIVAAALTSGRDERPLRQVIAERRAS